MPNIIGSEGALLRVGRSLFLAILIDHLMTMPRLALSLNLTHTLTLTLIATLIIEITWSTIFRSTASSSLYRDGTGRVAGLCSLDVETAGEAPARSRTYVTLIPGRR